MAALRRGGGRRGLAGAGARRGPGQRHRARGRPRAGARDRAAPAAARPPRSRWPSPGRRSADDQARLEAVRDALGPDGPGPGRRQRRAGTSTRRSRAIAAARPGRRRAGVRRAAVRERRGAGRRPARGRRADRGRRVDPPGRRPLPGARPRGRRHRGAQGAAARRRARLPADRRGHRAAGRGLVGAGDLGRDRRRASRWRRRCPSCPTPAGWRPCSCSPTTWSPSRCCRSTAMLPVGVPPGRPARAGPAGRRPPDRVAHWEARLARGARRVRQDRSLVNAATELARAVVTALVAAGVARGGARARLAQRPAVVRGVRRRRRRAAPAAHPDRRAHRRLPRPRADQGRLAGPRWSAPPAPPSPTCTRRCSRPPTPGCRWSWSPPTGRRGCAAPTPTRPPTRSGVFGAAGRRRRRRRRRRSTVGRPDGLVHLNVQLDDPLLPDGPLDAGPLAPSAAEPGARARDAADRRAARRSARAPSWSPATTPARRPGCSPQRAGWPLLAEPSSGVAHRRPRAPQPTGCCSAAELADADRAGRGLSATPRCPGRCSRLLARDDVEVARRRRAAAGPSGRSRSTGRAGRGRGRRPGRPGLAGGVAAPPTRVGVAAARRAARRRGRPHAVRGRRRGQPRAAARRAAGRRRLQPDPRPRPDGRRATRSAAAAR